MSGNINDPHDESVLLQAVAKELNGDEKLAMRIISILNVKYMERFNKWKANYERLHKEERERLP